jgi:hypothetical protein
LIIDIAMCNVEVKKSLIEGLGVFAACEFSTGERIRRVNIVREVTAHSPLREDLGERSDHCTYPNGKVLLYGFPDCHINHSCDPNAYEFHEGGITYIVARRTIRSGEEITCDYNINITNGTSWPCNCGAIRCQGLVAGDYFQLPIEWQREYRPLLADWFIRNNRDKIDALDAVSPP